MLTPEIRALLDGTPIAHLATVLPDGSPHSVPLWVGTHDDYVVIMTGPGSQKARNLRRDPRVALSLTPPDAPYSPVMLRGHVVAWLDGDEGWAAVDEIATKYTGGPYSRDSERVAGLIRIDHHRVGLG
ncbi:PPOX class F420-dependent oxidoreductase [Amycolatopsis acidicola]|uniref:PPOX class F420-dependent oxidoreductase n=1 Tax=Amycolatopsis acidicola TaxID=2596893 RepID=A0A5N0V074_9PSEU|nr:PPOX class F420-dependent oxidoreductase [Amycolatopsis acidicola]KAA9156017.1 PPOX class F420-dependent oxidoreductase [Amycolatopsis acidicola]